MARTKIKSATDQRKFTMVYNDFLESDLLNYYEKMIFIHLKKYADNNTLQAFPSLNTLHKISGMSKSKIQECIESMEKKGVLKKDHRTSSQKGHQSNLYTLYDYAEVWGVDTSQDAESVAEEITEAKMIAELRAKGYTVTKNEKRPDSEASQSTESSPLISQNNLSKDNDNIQESKNQEKYSMQDIQEIFDYEILKSYQSLNPRDIDAVFSILYDAFNTTKDTIRVMKEDKPKNVVISKLMKLDYEDIITVIENYNKQTEPIEYPDRYILTQLYKAKEQGHLKLMNKGHVNGDF